MDDSVQDKRYSQRIELVQRANLRPSISHLPTDKRYSQRIELVQPQYPRYSGAAGGIVRGIGVVNLIHTDGTDYYPIDFRIFAPKADGKTKNDHFREMLINAVANKRVKARRVLFDNWYASVDYLKLVVRLGLVFVTTLKNNRLVSLSKEGGYVHLQDLLWSEEQLKHGIVVKLKELAFKVRLFKVVFQLVLNAPTSQVVTMPGCLSR